MNTSALIGGRSNDMDANKLSNQQKQTKPRVSVRMATSSSTV